MLAKAKKRMVIRRYQIKKEVEGIVKSEHPWIFNSHLSSAAAAFKSGDWLSLVNGSNEIVGYGIYEKDALVSIRVFKRGKTPPNGQWFREKILKALMKRKALLQYTDAFRAVHGENDGLPGIVFDVYGSIGVLQTYVPSVDALGRYVAGVVMKELDLKSVLWKLPTRRKDKRPDRLLSGVMPRMESFREGKMKLSVDIGAGQKSGTFLDLRGLRKFVSAQKLNEKRVLNLFCYTGTLGLAAEVAGAKEIWNVDISKGALEFAEKYHTLNAKKHHFVAADVFTWGESLPPFEKFDFIIVDPPSMASLASQVPVALKAYARIYRLMLPHLKPGGQMIVCCCTSRITRRQFEEVARKSLSGSLKLLKSIGPEDDHPVGFPQGDYLKLLVFGASSQS